jgi:uncharacterized membrane protein YkvA (DUF1232 family)
MENQEQSVEINQEQLETKIQSSWKRAGRKVVETALQLYYSFRDNDTPNWAKAVILGALGYFITPVDAVPDFAPLLGFSDDLAMMLSALAVVAIHVKEEHREKARTIASHIFKG